MKIQLLEKWRMGENFPARLESLEPKAQLIARNTILNLLGQGIPLLIGLVAMPVVTRGLGSERFGLLSLSWIIIGYFLMFDLGLGRATTKYVAEMVAAGEDNKVAIVIWTSVLTQFVSGCIGACVFIMLSPILIAEVLKIPLSLKEEARVIFYILACGLPAGLIAASLSGALEAKQRFDLTNGVRVLSSAMLYIVPLMGVFFNLGLSTVVGLIVGARIAAVVALFLMNKRTYPEICYIQISPKVLQHLLKFGGWVSVSAVVGPVLVYAERLLLSTMVSLAAVGYYSAPLDALTKLLIIPYSLSTALFPMFSGMFAIRDQRKIAEVFIRSIRVLGATLLPPLLVIFIFARELLIIWLGSEFAQHSTTVLQITTVGLFINSLALVPYVLLQGMGRADLTGKYHLIELPIHIILSVLLIKSFGIIGAACAWTARLLIDAFLLFGTTILFIRWFPSIPSIGRMVRAVGVLVITASILGFIKLTNDSILSRFGLAVFTLCVLYFLAWVFILNKPERRFICKGLRRYMWLYANNR